MIDRTEAEPSDDGLDLATFTQWLAEIEEQPAWRAKADREADYYDGNQLDSAVLQKQRAIGMPPATEPLIGPTIDAVLGYEAKTRTDWRVMPDGDKSGDEVAEALNYRLNQAERNAQADKACSAAYASQVKVGIGWVEVARESNPFKFPYRCSAIDRNEIWWDFLCRMDLCKARYLVRRRWTERSQAKLLFPQHAELIEHAGSGWQSIDPGLLGLDGGASTDLAMSMTQERGWSVEEQQWRDTYNRRVCLFEVWYRQWVRALVMKLPDGRVVEYDPANPMHVQTVATGAIRPQWSVIGRVRLAWFMGPHKLSDEPSPYRHDKFPYVPFIGKIEDRTGVPYGLIRGMMYLQDEVNARIAKMQWGLAAVRTTRTEGAVLDDDDTFRQEVARPDADIVLDADHMARAGATFKVERDFELNRQQYERLIDAREGIKRTGGIYNSFMGEEGQAKSGVAIAGLVEQSNQAIADINDNFRDARSEVGDLLLSLVIEDLIGKEEEVHIDGGAIKDDKVIALNVPTTDPETGIEYRTNDVERIKLKVTLNDVPSTPSFRAQQLLAMSEAFKAAPPEYQKIMMPHLMSLMDVPNRDDIIEAIKQVSVVPTQEEIDQQIKDAVNKALMQAKAPLIEAQAKVANATAVKVMTEAEFAAMQAGQAIATMPQIAPIADVVMQNAGYQSPNPVGVDPNFPQPAVEAPPLDVQQNTSPQLPPVPQSPMTGIETLRNEQA